MNDGLFSFRSCHKGAVLIIDNDFFSDRIDKTSLRLIGDFIYIFCPCGTIPSYFLLKFIRISELFL